MLKSLFIACFTLCFVGTVSTDASTQMYHVEGKKSPLQEIAPLHTKKIRVKKQKDKEFHIAVYKDTKKLNSKKKLTIKTCMMDRGQFDHGVQTITLGKQKLSETKRVHFQVISGVEYVVHLHDNFKVYSADKAQYVFFKG